MEVSGGNWAVTGLMCLAAFGMGNLLLLLNHIAAPTKPSVANAQPYESGVPDVAPVKNRYSPRFYVVAMLFVIFDIEAIFIYPWAVVFDTLGFYGLVEMLSFIGLLLLGYVYAWKKGALEWV